MHFRVPLGLGLALSRVSNGNPNANSKGGGGWGGGRGGYESTLELYLDIETQLNSLKIKWIQRLLNPTNAL